MPLCAFALSTLLRLDEPLGVGMLLLGCAAGAPFLPKLAELAKGNLAFAVGTMVLLMVVTVGYLPVVLPLLLAGVAVDPAKIAQSLVLLMLLPLGVGLALKSRYADLAARVKPVLDRISNVSLILLVLLITAANIDKVLDVFGTRGILAGLSAHRSRFCHRLVARGTGQRHEARPGFGYWPAQHCRRTGGRESELQRSRGGRHGDRGRNRRVDHPHAGISRFGQSLTETVRATAAIRIVRRIWLNGASADPRAEPLSLVPAHHQTVALHVSSPACHARCSGRCLPIHATGRRFARTSSVPLPCIATTPSSDRRRMRHQYDAASASLRISGEFGKSGPYASMGVSSGVWETSAVKIQRSASSCRDGHMYARQFDRSGLREAEAEWSARGGDP